MLVASYLDVPLRYPLRLGGSRSYIFDYAPSIEPLLDSLTIPSKVSLNVKPTEFPLFLDGQDTTRAAYAIFLLNKVLSTFSFSLIHNFELQLELLKCIHLLLLLSCLQEVTFMAMVSTICIGLLL